MNNPRFVAGFTSGTSGKAKRLWLTRSPSPEAFDVGFRRAEVSMGEPADETTRERVEERLRERLEKGM